jgi:ion channel POLLUX/CASTOR
LNSIVYFLIFIVAIIVIILIITDLYFIQSNEGNVLTLFWFYLFKAIKGGYGGDITNGFQILVNFIVVLTSLFVSSIFIGFITNYISERLSEIRRGSSKILELNHQIILGWSPAISLVIRELLLANENNKNSKIVILDERDSVEMTNELKTLFPDKIDNKRIIARSGSSHDRIALDNLNINSARSILINHNDDMKSIKTLAAIVNNPSRREAKYNIVTKINSYQNYEVAKLVGKEDSQILFFGDMLARIDAQTCLQPGLSSVYLELVNFDGDEIYFKDEAALEGCSYSDAVLGYNTSCVIGLKRGTEIILNPSFNEIIRPKDKIIAITEDDDTIELNEVTKVKSSTTNDDTRIISNKVSSPEAKRIFILGHSSVDMNRVKAISTDLLKYIADGSEIIFANDAKGNEDLIESIATTRNIKLSAIQGDIRSRKFLEEIGLDDGDIVLIISPFNGVNDINQSDQESLYTLIHIRDIEIKTNKNFFLVTEIIDARNSEIFESEKFDDYLLSETIVQSMLVQIAENKHLGQLFKNLSSPEGCEIYFKPMTDYVDISKPINFYAICESAGLKGQTAIGYQLYEEVEMISLNAGVNINPKKSIERIYNVEDKIIVFSES